MSIGGYIYRIYIIGYVCLFRKFGSEVFNSFINKSLFPSRLLILGKTLADLHLVNAPAFPTQQYRLQHTLMLYLELFLDSPADLHANVLFLLGFECRNSELFSLT